MNFSLVSLTGALSLAALLPLRSAEVSAIDLRVEQVSNDKRTHFDETQKKTLKIFLTNSSSQDQAVKVKYYYFAKEVKDKAVIVLSEGEKGVTLKPHGMETIEAKPATASSSEKHRTGNGLHSKTAGKEVEASGQRIVGYGAQVLQGGKIVSDYFSEPSLKANVGGDR